MDLETENRIAAILMKEAAELRRQAEQDGVLAYLREPNVRARPNSRFLTATVLGVQQANRAVEVKEMWRVRRKELELDDHLKERPRDRSSSTSMSNRDVTESHRSKRHSELDKYSNPSPSTKRDIEDCYSRHDEGLDDQEFEDFLHSRVKRGRGSVGSRMDEAGPYPLRPLDSEEKPMASPDRGRDEWENRAVRGPEKPCFLKSFESSDEESDHRDRDKEKVVKKVGSMSSKDRHSKKHQSKSKSKSKDKFRDREKKRIK